jgi:ribonuclease D
MLDACARRHEVVDAPRDLERLAADLAAAPAIAVDLEADSMYHYRERVCLIQMAVPGGRNVLIDTMALADLGPLKPVFRDAGIRKIFHGADYDVRSLFRDFEIRIQQLFDTQLACRFLGYKETGLEAVLKNLFGIVLDKKFQRKDWSQRPLPPEMLAYAVADACHLLPLAERLEAELRAAGRLAWVREECRLLSQVRPAAPEERPLFMTCKGAGRLDPRGLAVLEGLLAYRRELARAKDRPLFKVFGHESLVKIAEARPASLEELKRAAALSPGQVERYGREILAIVKAGLKVPAGQLPVYPRKRPEPLPPAAAAKLESLRRWRDAKGRQLKLDPSLVCSKAALIAIAVKRPKSDAELEGIPELRQWQRRAFGAEILGLTGRGR